MSKKKKKNPFRVKKSNVMYSIAPSCHISLASLNLEQLCSLSLNFDLGMFEDYREVIL